MNYIELSQFLQYYLKINYIEKFGLTFYSIDIAFEIYIFVFDNLSSQ